MMEKFQQTILLHSKRFVEMQRALLHVCISTARVVTLGCDRVRVAVQAASMAAAGAGDGGSPAKGTQSAALIQNKPKLPFLPGYNVEIPTVR